MKYLLRCMTYVCIHFSREFSIMHLIHQVAISSLITQTFVLPDSKPFNQSLYTCICIAFWFINCFVIYISVSKFYIKLCAIVWSVNLFRFVDTFTSVNHLSYFLNQTNFCFETRGYKKKNTNQWYDNFLFQKNLFVRILYKYIINIIL